MNDNARNPSATKTTHHLIFQISLFVILLAFDRLTKYWAANMLRASDRSFLGDIIVFHYLENTGAAFGIFRNSLWLFYIITIIILILIGAFVIRINRSLRTYCRLSPPEFRQRTYSNMRFLTYLLTILASGALGNLIDRIWYGYVIDFIYLKWINFPVFNIADICVTFTAIVLIIFFIFIYKEDDNFKLFKR